MPKFLEDKLKKRYGKNSKVPYKIMNAIGAMKGNKETAKSKAMAKKHAKDTKKKSKTFNQAKFNKVRMALAKGN